MLCTSVHLLLTFTNKRGCFFYYLIAFYFLQISLESTGENVQRSFCPILAGKGYTV